MKRQEKHSKGEQSESCRTDAGLYRKPNGIATCIQEEVRKRVDQ